MVMERLSVYLDRDSEIDNDSLPELESISSDDVPDHFPNENYIETQQIFVPDNSNEITMSISDIRAAFTYTELQWHNNIYHKPFFIYNNIFVDYAMVC